jgi:multidrug efflux system outer membrane protein
MSVPPRFKSWHLIILALLLAGCAVGPNYKRPAVNAPKDFRGDTTGQINSMGDMPWWQLFHDEDLQALIRTALTNNYDVRIAAARVEQARAILAENRAGYFPQITYQGAAGRGRNVVAGDPSFVGGPAGNGFDAAGNVSWEIDLWGRIRRMNESARAQFLATKEELNRNRSLGLFSIAGTRSGIENCQGQHRFIWPELQVVF